MSGIYGMYLENYLEENEEHMKTVLGFFVVVVTSFLYLVCVLGRLSNSS